MASRLKLQHLLEGICNRVHFQPPSNVRLQYPCIIYKLTDIDSRYADDNPYNLERGYQVTYIDTNPDSIVPLKLASIQKSRFSNFFISDNLNHWVFTIYY